MTASPLFEVLQAALEVADGRPVDVPALRARVLAGRDQRDAHGRQADGELGDDLELLARLDGPLQAALDALEAGDPARARLELAVALGAQP